MKWFKHDTDALMSEGVDALIEKEGFAGYGRWNRILEIVAFKMDKTNRCHVEYSIQKWCSLLGLKQKKLTLLLELLENEMKIKVVSSENIIKIEIPNLLKKRDNYTKDCQVTEVETSTQEVEVEVEIEIEEKDSEFSPDSDEFRLANLLFNFMRKNNPTCKKQNLQAWAKTFDLILRVDKKDLEEVKSVIKWCQQDEFWFKNILSASKLRKQYDQLVLKMDDTAGPQGSSGGSFGSIFGGDVNQEDS